MQYQQIIEKPVSEKIFKDAARHAEKIVHNLKENLSNGSFPLISSLDNEEDIRQIRKWTKKLRKFKEIIILGTGGSSLTGQALTGTKIEINKPSIIFLDNVDPHTVDTVLKKKNLDKTFFLIISKSGNTLETIAQFLACQSVFEKKSNRNMADNFLLITDPGESILRSLAKENDIPCLDHEQDIGGRFSIFTNVGLLPACLMDLDIEGLRKGAKKVAEEFFRSTMPEPVKGAIQHVRLMKGGIRCNALMPYIDRLEPFAVWYRQLWAETLGKNGLGTTPIKAMGTIDQHSQLQLYLDGPKDKFFTLITTDYEGKGQKLKKTNNKKIDYLKNKTMGDVLEAEFHATRQALINKGCPVREIRLKNLSEESIGALAMHFILETIVVAHLLGVNPFDQPAVEGVKSLARDYLREI